jgi:hypothetical protein
MLAGPLRLQGMLALVIFNCSLPCMGYLFRSGGAHCCTVRQNRLFNKYTEEGVKNRLAGPILN